VALLFLGFAFEHHPFNSGNPEPGAGWTVLLDQHFPGAVVHSDFAVTVDDGHIQGEYPSDILVTTTVEEGIGCAGGMPA